jgi:hypothetical protein
MTDLPDPCLRDALERLRASVHVPAHDPVREQTLLRAFDHGGATRSRRPFVMAMALSAAVVTLAIMATPPAPPAGDRQAHDPLAEFVAWPGADAYPTLESASVVRVHLPAGVIAALGLATETDSTSLVPADLLVGQDGLTRAVRLAAGDGSSPQD